MRTLQIAAVAAWTCGLSYAVVALGTVANGSFTATWTPAADPAEQYEFRWRHFGAADWLPLPTVPGASGSLRVTFPALPNTPTTDRWMCLDARSRVGDAVSAWLSETPEGAACNTVDAAIIPLPTPPPIPPQQDVFTNVTQRDGRLSLDYRVADCPRGVQQTTSAIRDGHKTITLTCRR